MSLAKLRRKRRIVSLFDWTNNCGYEPMRPYFPTLVEYARKCHAVAEFGVQAGNSTRAFLTGIPAGGVLHSYDIDWSLCPVDELATLNPAVEWHRHQADTGGLESLPPVDLLFIDSLHTYEHIMRELMMLRFVKRFVAFHDSNCGEVKVAISDWRNKQWKLIKRCEGHLGMEIYQRAGHW